VKLSAELRIGKMCKILTSLVSLLVIVWVCCPSVLAQDETFTWDGDTNSDWFETTNWQVFGGDPDPMLGDPPVPDANTRVELTVDGTTSVPTPVVQGGAAIAREVRIGRSEGAGKLTINSGSLSTGFVGATIMVRVANGNNGTLEINGGTLNVLGTMTTGDGNAGFKGQITMTGGAINITGADRDLNMDEFAGSTAASNLTMSNGTISIADVLLVDNFASIDLSGGTITAAAEQAGALRVRRNGEVRLTGGLLETKDDIELGNASIEGGTIKIDGGIVRAFRLGTFGATAGIQINGSGLFQVDNSQADVATLQGLISGGLITSAGSLAVSVVDVGGINFTQVALAAAGLAGDYNGDGFVDAADYTVWRNNLGGDPSAFEAGSRNPGNASPTINGDDYTFWKTNYGMGTPPGAGGLAGLSGGALSVPEPTLLASGWLAFAVFLCRWRRNRVATRLV
jgi:hypothetical protein